MAGGRSPGELRQLISSLSLTREEILFLRLLFLDVQRDLIADLPIELIAMIALHLEMGDIARCLRVSKTWRAKFLSDAVILPFARREWPAIVRGNTTPSDAQAFLSRFGSILASYDCWRSGSGDPTFVRWDNAADIGLDPVVHSTADDPPHTDIRLEVDGGRLAVMYAFGKVAFCPPDSFRVVVDDIVSMTRKVLESRESMVGGSHLRLHAVGSKLVVTSVGRLLLIWDHVDNVSYKKSVPSDVVGCTIQDNKLAVILRGGVVLIWTCGTPMLQLNTSILKDKIGMGPFETGKWNANLSAFFDPRDSKTIFLASAYTPSSGDRHHVRFTVHEYANENYVASWASDIVNMKWWTPSTEFRIQMLEYECEQAQILFTLDDWIGDLWFLAAFCKVKRRFTYFAYNDPSYYLEPGEVYAVPEALRQFHRAESKDPMSGCDLDFMVQFKDDGYLVNRTSTRLSCSRSS
ncbi:hypothetical protein F5Y17DRAFT_357174 [Xylariaceae sp. FL0594]|nr:hypothetical protein F5Y17DRAFT_357174 [Xylariaceae sp. FL0594]